MGMRTVVALTVALIPVFPYDISSMLSETAVLRVFASADWEITSPGTSEKSTRMKNTFLGFSVHESASAVIRTAICFEPRNGRLHVFMPPVTTTEDYIDLVAAVEDVATAMKMPIIIEGTPPPFDPRLDVIKVTPDPGVIEVNMHPVKTWKELVSNTTVLYEEARLTRLGSAPELAAQPAVDKRLGRGVRAGFAVFPDAGFDCTAFSVGGGFDAYARMIAP